MAAIKAVAHFSIPVSDFARSTRFYTDIVSCRHLAMVLGGHMAMRSSHRRFCRVAIFPCVGGRDEAGERALATAFDKGGAERVTRLYHRDDVPEDQCWLRAPGWCLSYL